MSPKRLLPAAILALLASAAVPAAARDIDRLQTLSQAEFRALSQDLGAGLSYKPLTPAAPLGTAGFDLGVAATSTRLQHRDALDKASGGDFGSRLTVPSLRVNKGLPAGFDIGLMGAAGSGSNIRLWGGELRYALLEGGVARPAIGLRGSYTKVTGIDQLSLNTRGLDVSISKGFLMLTPYAGIGRVWTESTPNGVAGLSRESFSERRVFFGVNLNLAVVNLAFETDRTGDARTYGVKLGWRF
jgi:hypothetical protein